MTIKQLQNKTYLSTSLSAGEVDLLLARALHKPLEYIYKNAEKKVRRSTVLTFGRLLKMAEKGCPIAYLLGYKEFFGKKFLVNKNILVPRPDSELIISTTLAWIKKNTLPETRIADIGTGSGCLIVTLADQLQTPASFSAIDISAAALRVARTNARKIIGPNKIQFIKNNLLNKISHKFNVVVANLPYLTGAQMSEPSIQREPRRALYGGKNGLEIIEKLVAQLPEHLDQKYLIILEIDPAQSESVQKIIKNTLPAGKVSVIQDLSNSDRLIAVCS